MSMDNLWGFCFFFIGFFFLPVPVVIFSLFSGKINISSSSSKGEYFLRSICLFLFFLITSFFNELIISIIVTLPALFFPLSPSCDFLSMRWSQSSLARLLLTLMTRRLILFISTAVMIGTVTFSFSLSLVARASSLLFSFHYTSQNWPSRGKRVREREICTMTERVKNANQMKMYVQCETNACMCRKIEFIWTDNVVSREIRSIFKQHTYGIDAYLYAHIKVMFSHTIRQWHPLLRTNSPFSLHVYILSRERVRVREKKSK